jgi:hypothetical protein
MYRRIGFSVALIAVLFGFWLLSTKPVCQDGFAASYAPRFGWSCVASEK